MIPVYLIDGFYQDPSAQNGIVKLNAQIVLLPSGIVAGHKNTDIIDKKIAESVPYYKGHFKKTTDIDERIKFGEGVLKILEKNFTYNSTTPLEDSFCTNTFYLIHTNSAQLIVGEHLGERIESFKTIKFSNNYEEFNKQFSACCSLCISYPVKINISRLS
jgi:hypothetical protein